MKSTIHRTIDDLTEIAESGVVQSSSDITQIQRVIGMLRTLTEGLPEVQGTQPTEYVVPKNKLIDLVAGIIAEYNIEMIVAERTSDVDMHRANNLKRQGAQRVLSMLDMIESKEVNIPSFLNEIQTIIFNMDEERKITTQNQDVEADRAILGRSTGVRKVLKAIQEKY